jgi:quercetin dioxygenase-like cupin family protein
VAVTARIARWSGEEAALDPRVRRRLFTAKREMVVVCSLPHKLPRDHTHSVDQVIAVLSGRVEIRAGGKLRILETGEAFDVPAGTPHAARSVGPKEAETLNVFSPEV